MFVVNLEALSSGLPFPLASYSMTTGLPVKCEKGQSATSRCSGSALGKNSLHAMPSLLNLRKTMDSNALRDDDPRTCMPLC